MTESIEIEYKNLLTDTEYARLLNTFNIDLHEAYWQKNVYYDTASLALKKNNMGLRIRLFTEYAELTLKSPLPIGLLETTDRLTLAQANCLVAEKKILTTGTVASKLKSFDVSPTELLQLGILTTKRVEYPLSQASTLVLDENWYGQKHDFELEIEVTSNRLTDSYFTDFLHHHNIPERPTKNKIRRMFDEQKI